MNDDEYQNIFEKVSDLENNLERLHDRFTALTNKIEVKNFTIYLMKLEDLNEKVSKNMQGLNNMILDVKGILSQVSTWRKHEQPK